MKVTEQRLLRGPNRHARNACLQAVLALEDLAGVASDSTPGMVAALVALLPSLGPQAGAAGPAADFAARMAAGTDLADVVLHVTLALQRTVGAGADFGLRTPLASRPGEYRVVFSYQVEHVAQAAFALAVNMVDALAHGAPFDAPAEIGRLQAVAGHHAVDADAAQVVAAAQARGIPVLRVSEHADLFQLGWGSKQRRLRTSGGAGGADLGQAVIGDRQMIKALLEEAAIAVPRGGAVETLGDALRVARRLGGTVVVKPARADDARIRPLRCVEEQDVARAFELARQSSRAVIVERLVEGRNYRVRVAGGEVVAVNRRGELPLALISGTSTAVVQSEAPADESTDDLSALLPDESRALCLRAAAKIGFDPADINIVCADIGLPLAPQGGAITAVKPGAASAAAGNAVMPGCAALLDAMFGREDDGRIPVIALTGTNGKTTTTLMVAHAAREAGLRTGCTTTQGIFVDGQPIARGDCTGYWSHRAVLNSPNVDIAVLETARGGILKRGLAFDRSTVGVVLNVAADHLGLDGIDTVEDLAAVKELVAATAGGSAVLNAQDPLCVAMAERLDPGVDLFWFSMDPQLPLVRRHLERGGRAMYLKDEMLVLAQGGQERRVMPAARIPATLGGRARYNIANALAAAAALVGAGFTLEQVAAGLSTFVSDNKTNPLRTNVFEVRGVTVVVDYAHNSAAYAAMAEMARAMQPGLLVGVVTAPGDRRDEDLRQVGRVCGAGFDALVVYESSGRGRGFGETARLLREGALEAAAATCSVGCEYEVHAALRQGLGMCGPGDVLVFSCATSVQVLVDAVRPIDGEAADRIAAMM